jgi:3-oxoacyl-[acyl-carrier protein] reductase
MVFDAEDAGRDSPMRRDLSGRGVSREPGKFGEHWKNGPRATGRIAIVAAASKGLGRAVAEELAREGTHVATCSREAKNLEQTAAEIKSLTKRKVFWRVVDVEQEKAIAAFVADVEKEFGRAAICVTNSGGSPSHSFAETEPEEWRAAFDQLLLSVVFIARETLPRLKKSNWRRFITITSSAVRQPVDGLLLSNSVCAA